MLGRGKLGKGCSLLAVPPCTAGQASLVSRLCGLPTVLPTYAGDSEDCDNMCVWHPGP